MIEITPQSKLRNQRIEQISESIKEVKLCGNILDEKKLEEACMDDWGIRRVTAQEYIKAAQFRAEKNND